MLQSLETRVRAVFARKTGARLDLGLLALALVAVAVMASAALGVGHWRHDELEYLEWGDLIYRTQTEGRWLNLILYYPAKIFSPELAWITGTALLGAGYVLVFRWLGLNTLYATLASATLIVFPGYAAQSMWPSSNLPSLAIFFGTAVLLSREKLWVVGQSRLWLLPPAGIALFATIPYFYFMLIPMLVPKKQVRSWADFALALVPGIIWGSGLVLGYLVAILLNGLRYGYFGLRLQDWRIQDAPALEGGFLINLMRNMVQMVQDIGLWLPALSILAWLVLTGLVIFIWFREGGTLATFLTRLGYIAVLALMPYLVGAAGGIMVQFRSIPPLAMALLALPLVFSTGTSWRVVVMAGLLVLGAPSLIRSLTDLSWFSTYANANIAVVRQAEPEGVDTNVRAVLLPEGFKAYGEAQRAKAGLANEKPIYMEGLFARDYRIGPAFVEAGYASFETCSSDQIDCPALRVGETPLPDCATSQGPICAVSVLNDGSLLFAFTSTIDDAE